MTSAVFLDRDNTLIHNDGDLGDPDEVQLIQGTASAIASLVGLGYKIIVVTNQGGVARGKYTESDVDLVHQRINELIEDTSGVSVDRFYYCPYHPEGTRTKYRKEHPWRKPKPGMLLQAAKDLELDLVNSWMIGDAVRDVQAGFTAGVTPILLDDPSQPSHAMQAVPPKQEGQERVYSGRHVLIEAGRDYFIARNLVEAVRIVGQQRRPDSMTEARKSGRVEVAPVANRIYHHGENEDGPDIEGLDSEAQDGGAAQSEQESASLEDRDRDMPEVDESVESVASEEVEQADVKPSKKKAKRKKRASRKKGAAKKKASTKEEPSKSSEEKKTKNKSKTSKKLSSKKTASKRGSKSAAGVSPDLDQASQDDLRDDGSEDRNTSAVEMTDVVSEIESISISGQDVAQNQQADLQEQVSLKLAANDEVLSRAERSAFGGDANLKSVPRQSESTTSESVEELLVNESLPNEVVPDLPVEQVSSARDQIKPVPAELPPVAQAEAAANEVRVKPGVVVPQPIRKTSSDASRHDVRVKNPDETNVANVAVSPTAVPDAGSKANVARQLSGQQSAARVAKTQHEPEPSKQVPAPAVRRASHEPAIDRKKASQAPAESVHQTLRQILSELRNQRDSHADFNFLNVLAIILQLMAVVCLLAGLLMGANNDQLFARWIGCGVLLELMTIVVLMFRK
jgi:D,D-heptose 1,7-bisphosphate phosphatase